MQFTNIYDFTFDQVIYDKQSIEFQYHKCISTYESQIFVALDLNTFTELSDQSRVRMFSTAR